MRKNRPLLLLLLCVTLLVVISTRVAPKIRSEEDVGEEDVTVTESPATPEPTPTPPEETPQPRGREVFPEASLGDWNLKLVNGLCVLPSTFTPQVIEIRDEQYIDIRISEPLEAMLTAAEEAGYTVCIRNAYRPFATQAYIFNGRASQIQWGTTKTLAEAEQEARKVVAYPGTSEHQTGLCVDVMDAADSTMSAESAKELPVLQWLTEHCAEYGFILRYPEEKEELTGWNEPWHFRYVGEGIAAYIMENGLCLEEFIDRF